jgi:hypothetical protein
LALVNPKAGQFAREFILHIRDDKAISGLSLKKLIAEMLTG